MKKNSKQQKHNEARIAAEVIAKQIIQNTKTPSARAIIQRIGSLTAAAAKNGPAAFAFALSLIDQQTRLFWKAQHTEARAVMFRISSLTQAAAQRGPDAHGPALLMIQEAARNFWKQARA